MNTLGAHKTDVNVFVVIEWLLYTLFLVLFVWTAVNLFEQGHQVVVAICYACLVRS